MNEEFEKWLSDWIDRNPNPCTVLTERTVWEAAWQASRKQALEEARNLAETAGKQTEITMAQLSSTDFPAQLACKGAIAQATKIRDAIQAMQKD